jgi:iron transport multicopper oxidase
MSVGSAATNPVVYGVNANAFVLNSGQLIEIVINNYDTGGHPIHLHGHAVQLVARAAGNYTPPKDNHGSWGHPKGPANALGYDGNTAKMPRIPMRRDTWIVAAGGYTVLRFIADNPGVWFLHCHMEWHQEAGLAATVVEDPIALQKSESIPQSWYDVCHSQGIPTAGNAAGNTKNYTDLTGANTVCPPLGSSSALVVR